MNNRFLARVANRSLVTFGILWLIIEPFTLVMQDLVLGIQGYLVLVLISVVPTLILNRPRRKISKKMSNRDAIIEIKIGDVFREKSGNLVIGTNDYFDTQLDDIVARTSIQGQFTVQMYNSDHEVLDADIAASLASLNVIPEETPEKTKGKTKRYPPGAIATVERDRKYYLLAFTEIQDDFKTKTDAHRLWLALHELWVEVDKTGAGAPLIIPVLGSKLGRMSMNREIIIKLIILSFAATATYTNIDRLTVMVYTKDRQYVDMYALEDFLDSVAQTA